MEINDQIAKTILLEPLYEKEHRVVEELLYALSSFDAAKGEYPDLNFNISSYLHELSLTWEKVEELKNPKVKSKTPIEEESYS